MDTSSFLITSPSCHSRCNSVKHYYSCKASRSGMPRAVRKNGFQQPRSDDQITVMIFYPLLTAVFIGLLSWLEHRDIPTLFALLVPHLVMVSIVLGNWYMVESINPEANSSNPGRNQLSPGIRVVCFDQSVITTRYCASCRKQVYGLDHHCSWLNTCVGARNYVFFFSLVVTGTCQMLYQSILGVFYMTLWREDTPPVPDDGPTLIVFYSLVSLFSLLSVILTIAFSVLLLFHLYLLFWIRAGTYDWMMGGRTNYHEQARAKAQKLEYEAAHTRHLVGNNKDVEGHITATGDIEFVRVRNLSGGEEGKDKDKDKGKGKGGGGDEEAHEHASASGDDMSHLSHLSDVSEEECEGGRDEDAPAAANVVSNRPPGHTSEDQAENCSSSGGGYSTQKKPAEKTDLDSSHPHCAKKTTVHVAIFNDEDVLGGEDLT